MPLLPLKPTIGPEHLEVVAHHLGTTGGWRDRSAYAIQMDASRQGHPDVSVASQGLARDYEMVERFPGLGGSPSNLKMEQRLVRRREEGSFDPGVTGRHVLDFYPRLKGYIRNGAGVRTILFGTIPGGGGASATVQFHSGRYAYLEHHGEGWRESHRSWK